MTAITARRLVLALAAALTLAACGNLSIDPPAKDPALYGMPAWTP